jgi:hypothetical protein
MKSCRPPLFWKRKFEPQIIRDLRSLVFAFLLELA